MKLTKAQQRIYNLLKERGRMITREIDRELFMTRSSMRISEINHQARGELGHDLIVNDGRNKSREVYKKLAAPLTKEKSVYKYDSARNVMVEYKETVEV